MAVRYGSPIGLIQMATLPRLRKMFHRGLRKAVALLPQGPRQRVYRSFVDCDPNPDPRLVLKIAETREELEACFRLLHDAYVASGFMQPDPSGLRVTLYHALPTTTTLCAKFDGEVVGTLSLIRESAIGFPLQRIFDLGSLRTKGGNIAEASALAVHPRFRRTGSAILFALMKFMYEYCTTFFDTRHLVIACNPRHIQMYESLLFFRRLSRTTVAHYDFVNGAPAVGATLDLKRAREVFRRAYGGKPDRRNLYRYFMKLSLPNIQMPVRRFYTTNDPVMTPELIDYFFNQRTSVFARLSDRKKGLLHRIYDLPEYRAVLPPLPESGKNGMIRRHPRYSVKCPARLLNSSGQLTPIEIRDVSRHGIRARVGQPVQTDTWLTAIIRLGSDEVSRLTVQAIQQTTQEDSRYCNFLIGEPDLPWRKFVNALNKGHTHADLEQATRDMA